MTALEPFDQFIVSVSRDTWDVFRRDPLIFLLAAVLLTVLSVLSLGVIAGPLLVGYVELVRRSRRGEPLALGVLFSRFDAFVSSSVALFLISMGVMIGLFLLVVPGLLVGLFSTFAVQVIAYEQASGIDAIRRSVQLVRDNLMHTLALVLLASVAHAIGSVVVFGVLVTMPLSMIAFTIAYERVMGSSAARVVTI
jgi:hypothetical protein